MVKNGLTRYALSLLLVAAFLLSALSAYLRSFNEVNFEEREQGEVKTRIGDFVSSDSIGTFPISLIAALNRWPSSRDCMEGETSELLLWNAFGSVTDLKVCLTRIIAAMNASADMDAFFLRNGFNASTRLRGISSKRSTAYVYSCGQNSVCSRWAESQVYFFIRPYSLNVRVTLSDDTLSNVSITELLE